MSKSRELHELMTAVDAGHAVEYADGASSERLLIAARRASYGRDRKSAPTVVVETPAVPSDASFEFSAAVSYISASPASMVFSDGQLRAHQFPAVWSSAGSSQAASPVRSSSMGSGGAKFGLTGSKKRVSFAIDSADRVVTAKASGGLGKKSGGMLGCMGSACGLSRDEVVEPAKNTNRKVVAV